MSRLLFALACAVACLSLLVAQGVRADTPTVTLLAGAKIDYRFDYRGDGSQIRVAIDDTDASALELGVYTPAQVDALRRGETVTPVGRGMPSKEHALFWAGGFRVPGVYHAIVTNRSANALTFRIDIGGDSVSGAAQVYAVATPPANTISTQGTQKVLTVALPPSVGANLKLTLPAEPGACTHNNKLPAVINASTKLCPNEIYPPLRISGNNIGLFTDAARTAIVTSAGRQYAITVEGNSNWIEGVVVQARADTKDLGAWLCLYDECLFPTRPVTTTVRGGTGYGGGILLRGSNSTVHGVTVKGGTIGVATVDGRNNFIIDNQLSDLNGWGSYNVNSVATYYVGNTLDRDNHGCTMPDGRKLLHGCETAGWVCLNCQANWIVRNHCELSGNCYYMSGERGLASNDNRLVANYCAGATDNCFEITFGQRNVLQDNVSTVEPDTDAPCKYPFWIGGSVVYFKGNSWECSVDADDAFSEARDSTIVATNIININEYAYPPGMPTLARGAGSATPVPTTAPRATPARPYVPGPWDPRPVP